MKTTSHWPLSILSSVGSIVNMVLPLALVRILSAEDIGAYKIFFLYLSIMPAFSFTSGLLNGLYFWAGREKKERTRAIRISFLLHFYITLIFSLIVVINRGVISSYIGWTPSLVILFCTALFATMASMFFEETLIATGQIWWGAVINLGFDLFRSISMLLVAWQTKNITHVFMVYSGLHLFKFLMGSVILFSRRQVTFNLKYLFLIKNEMRTKVWNYAFPVSISWAFGVFVNYADQMVLTLLVSAKEFAYYAMGCLSVPPLLNLEISVTRVLIPNLTAAFAKECIAPASGLYKKAVRDLAWVLIPAVTGLSLFASPITQLLFSSRFSSASDYLRIYAFSYLFLILPFDSIARARGDSKWILKSNIAFSLMALALCPFMIQTLGLGTMGALYSLFIIRLLFRIYSIYYTKRVTGWRLSEFLPFGDLFQFALISGTLAALCLLTKGLFVTDLMWLLSMGPGFALFYFFFSSIRTPKKDVHNKHILMLTQYLGIGGLERMIFNLSCELKNQDWKVHTFVFDHADNLRPENTLLGSFTQNGLTVTTLAKQKGFAVQTVSAIARTLRKHKITLIHSHDLGALLYGALAKIWIRLVWREHITLIHTQHSFVHLSRKMRYRFYEKFFAFFADQISVVSQESKTIYQGLRVPTQKLHVIANGVEFPHGPISSRDEKLAIRRELITLSPRLLESLWILYMARIHGGKGQSHAVRLWNHMLGNAKNIPLTKDDGPNFTLLFVGPETERGQLAKLKNQVATSLHPDRIVIAGPTHEPKKWLLASDMYWSSSEYEGMPLGPIEARGTGLPTLLSEIPGHSTLQGLSFQYPLNDLEAGSQAFALALRSAQNPSPLLWQEAEGLRNNYSVSKMTERYVRLYKLNEHSSP